MQVFVEAKSSRSLRKTPPAPSGIRRSFGSGKTSPRRNTTEIDTAVDLLGLENDEPLISYTDRTVYRRAKRAVSKLEDETTDEGWGFVDVPDLRRSWATRILSEGVLPSVLMDWGGRIVRRSASTTWASSHRR